MSQRGKGASRGVITKGKGTCEWPLTASDSVQGAMAGGRPVLLHPSRAGSFLPPTGQPLPCLEARKAAKFSSSLPRRALTLTLLPLPRRPHPFLPQGLCPCSFLCLDMLPLVGLMIPTAGLG